MLLDLDAWQSHLQTDRVRHRWSRCRDPRCAPTGLPCRAARLRSMMIVPRLRLTLARLPAAWRSRHARTRTRGALAVMLGLGAALLVSCGGSSSPSLIPAQNAEPLQQAFRSVAEAAQAGDGNCGKTENAIDADRTGVPAPARVRRPGPRGAPAKGDRKSARTGPRPLRRRGDQESGQDEHADQDHAPAASGADHYHAAPDQSRPKKRTRPKRRTPPKRRPSRKRPNEEEPQGGVTVPSETVTVPESETETGNAGGTKAEGNDGGTPVGPGGGGGSG